MRCTLHKALNSTKKMLFDIPQSIKINAFWVTKNLKNPDFSLCGNRETTRVHIFYSTIFQNFEAHCPSRFFGIDKKFLSTFSHKFMRMRISYLLCISIEFISCWHFQYFKVCIFYNFIHKACIDFSK